MPKSLSARIFVALVIVLGFAVLGNAVLNAHSLITVRLIALLVLASLAARLKVKLPGITGTMSVNLPFILLAAALMGPAEALAVGFISTFAQCLPRGKQKLNLVQVIFNCCAITLAVAAARMIFVSAYLGSVVASPALRLAIAAAGYFLVNTVAVSLVISLSEGADLVRTWVEMFQLSFAYLVAGAGAAGVALTVGQEIGWQVPLALLPIMLGVFCSYRRFFTASKSAAATAMQHSGAAAAAHV
ncbi:MAG: hypothetical protein WA738_11525 [Candidatus Angelobacter sp.]